MRENRSHGSEGGEAQTFPTPIVFGADLSLPQGVDARDKPGQGAVRGKLGANRLHELPSTFPARDAYRTSRAGMDIEAL